MIEESRGERSMEGVNVEQTEDYDQIMREIVDHMSGRRGSGTPVAT